MARIIGRELPPTSLVLIMGEDFDYSLRNKDGSAFPSDLSFALKIGATTRAFAFNAGRTVASLLIESTDISKALNWASYSVTSKSTAVTPPRDKVLAHGQVSVRGAS